MTVLVLEDDHNVLAFIERLLTQKGYKVHPAEDPDHARTLLEEHGKEIELLLIDVILPGCNGLDFAREAKAEYPALKIIFMTGLVHQSPKVLRSGLGPLLRKPFTSDDLLKTMASL